MGSRSVSANPATATDAAWLVLSRLLKSIRSRPVAWLLSIWIAGWGLFVWHIVHPSSWQSIWDTLHHIVAPQGTGRDVHTIFTWLDQVGSWGQVSLQTS